MKSLRILVVLIKANWQSYLQYRLHSLLWVINGSIGPFLAMAIWILISTSRDVGLNSTQIGTYFFMSLLVSRLTQVWTLDKVGHWIKDGHISNVLVKPHSYVLENLAEQFGQKSSRLSMIFIFMLAAWPLLSRHVSLSFDAGRLWLSVLAVILGFILLFSFEHVLALLAFWTDEITGVARVHDTLQGLFSGYLVPIAFMPAVLKSIMTYYPARFVLSFPLEILIIEIPYPEIIKGFLICVSWIVGLVITYRLVFKIAVKKYSSVGT